MALQNWSERVLLVTPPEDPGFTEDLSEALATATRVKRLAVVVDMRDVRLLSSSNLSLLLRLRKVCLTNRRDLILCNLATQAWGTFLATGLDSIFVFSDDVTTALTTVSLDQGT